MGLRNKKVVDEEVVVFTWETVEEEVWERQQGRILSRASLYMIGGSTTPIILNGTGP